MPNNQEGPRPVRAAAAALLHAVRNRARDTGRALPAQLRSGRFWQAAGPLAVLVLMLSFVVLTPSTPLPASAARQVPSAHDAAAGAQQPAPAQPAEIPLTTAVRDINSHLVESAILADSSNQVQLTYKADRAGTVAVKVVTVPADYMGAVEQDLVTAAVPTQIIRPRLTGSTPGGGVALLPLLLVMAAGVAVSVFLTRRGRRSAAAAVEPRRKAPAAVEVPTTRFTDVAGADEAIAELRELVLFLTSPDQFTRLGAEAPKGALLCGPPGTGKTLLARAVAGEAGVPFFAAAGSDFVEKYVGVGAQRVRDLFAQARQHERAIVFLDEVDAVAAKRGGDRGAGGGNSEADQTLVALLAEMDGFHSTNVIVIAATNRPDVLDDAITRPGRLDRKVEVPNPDRRGRQLILNVHTRRKPIAADVDLLALARRTPGFSGAQLKSLVNEACIDAVRRSLLEVTQECFDHAVATIAMGRARTSAMVTEHDRRITAWHESGHTLAAYLQADADDPVQVTIVPRGPAGGVTWMSGNDNSFLTRRQALAQLVTALAGRAAEEILLDGEYTQGASGDLSAATNLAHQMATQYGMTKLGYRVHHPQVAASSQTVAEVVEELLADAYASAAKLLNEHRDFLAAVAARLLDEETLTLADISEIAAGSGVARHAVLPVSPPARGRQVPEAQAPAAGDREPAVRASARRRRVPAYAITGRPRRRPAVAGGTRAAASAE